MWSDESDTIVNFPFCVFGINVNLCFRWLMSILYMDYVVGLVPQLSPKRYRSSVARSLMRRQGGTPRILFVVTSFDRGTRLGTRYRGLDKLDYVLMIADEMREACEVCC